MSLRKRESKSSKTGYTYEVRFVYDDFGLKKRYTKSGFQTKKEAEEHEAKMRVKFLKDGGKRVNEDKTLHQVYQEFLEIGVNEYQYNTIRDTKRDYKQFADELGRYPIAKITYPMLQKYFNSRKEKGIESNKNIRKTINRIFKYALKCGYLDTNPVQLVKVIGKENKRTNHEHVISFDELSTICHLLEMHNTFRYDSYRIAILIGYYTGLRISEAFALEWNDIDFEKNTINVCKKLEYTGLKKKELHSVDKMKNKTSKSIIPLVNSLKEELLKWRTMNPFQLLICDEDGFFLVPRVFETSVNKEIKDTINFRFYYHMLRHNFASVLYENGVDVKTAQELMRHADVNTTLSIYTHLNESQKGETLNKVFENISMNHSKNNSWVENGSEFNKIN